MYLRAGDVTLESSPIPKYDRSETIAELPLAILAFIPYP